jgi:dienelactone hydrolase
VSKVRPWFAAIIAAALLAVGACQSAPDDIPVTFERGKIRIGGNILERLGIDPEAARATADKSPDDDWLKVFNLALLDLITGAAKPGDRFPIVVYAHGCGGMTPNSHAHVSMLEDLGDYVVVAPDSFARKRPQSCWSPGAVDLGATRVARGLRRAELVHALDRVARLPWVDKDNIFLVGHSQGGGMVLGYAGEVRIKGRVSLNGACYSRFPRAGITGNGLRPDEAVLVFDSGRDPWFARYYSECPEMARRHPNGRLVHDADDDGHNLIAQPKYRAILEAWLKELSAQSPTR